MAFPRPVHGIGGDRTRDTPLPHVALRFVESVAALDQAFADAMEQKGPCLIEVML